MTRPDSSAPDGFGGFASQLMRGVKLPFSAFSLLRRQKGIRRYALLPFALNCVLYVILLAVGIYLLLSWEVGTHEWDFWGGTGVWLAEKTNAALETFKWLIGGSLLLIASYFTFTFVGITLGFPLLDLLCEKVEHRLGGEHDEIPFFKNMMMRITNGVYLDSFWLNAKWGMIALAATLGGMLVPVVGQVVMFVVVGYSLGIMFVDIPMARNFMRNRHKDCVMRRRWVEVLGFGMAMEALLMIPFVGVLILPIGAVAAAMFYCECDWARLFAENELEPPKGFIAPALKASPEPANG